MNRICCGCNELAKFQFAFAIFAAHSFMVMSDRQLILEAVQKMPAEASTAEILDELALLASVKIGLEQSERGEGVPHEQVVKLLDTWISKSSGRRAA
jgi:predicted transcriptional regulator